MASAWTSVGNVANGLQFTSALRTVYSALIMFAAQPVERFAQLAEIREELSVVPGKDIQFMKYDALSDAEDLTELADMTVEGMAGSTVSITVTEKGKAVGVSEYLLQTSFTDLMADASALLGHNYAKKEDSDLRDVCLACSSRKYARLNGTGTAAASSAEITANHTFSTALVKDAVELLATNNVPKIGGEFYVCLLNPHAARQIRDDPAWISAHQYAGSRNIFLGEIGMYEDVVFIETTQMGALSGSGSGGGSIYPSLMFGDMFLGYAISVPVELRDNGVESFGRKHSLAWYSIYGASLLQDGFGVRLESG